MPKEHSTQFYRNIVSFNLDLPTSATHLARPHSPVQSCSGIVWHKVTEFNLICFRNHLSSSLPSLPPDLISCSNPSCVLHQSLLDRLCSSLLASISQSAIQFLPLVNSRSSAIPGWNEVARSLKSKASFWHKVWLEAGLRFQGSCSLIPPWNSRAPGID